MDTDPKSNNLLQAEIDKFGGLADKWWDPTGPSQTLHHINPLRVQFIAEHANIAGAKIVDVGCGAGILTEGLHKLNGQMTGIDATEQMIQVARQHADKQNFSIDYQTTTAEAFAEKHAEQFDIVTCLELIEHVPDPASLVQACTKLLKPGGRLFFSTINRNPKSFLFAIVGAEYVLNLLPKGTHHYNQFIQPAELSDWCETAGCDVTSIMGMKYNPFTKQARLTSDLSVNYFLFAIKPQIDLDTA